MATFYSILVLIHIFSAILGMGPGFVLLPIVRSARTMNELKQVYQIKKRLHIYVMTGGLFLIGSGLAMGLIHPYLFHMGWYVTSMVLFLISLAMGPLVLAPKSKPIKVLLATHRGHEIPEEYMALSKQLFRYERVENIIFLIIIALMILKPF